MTNMTKRLLSLAIAVIMMISLLPVSVFAETTEALPQADVTKLSATTLAGGDYMIWPSGDDTIDRPLEIAVKFAATDSLEECLAGAYANWLVDFYLTIEGLSGESIVADNCYLAGNYGSFGWVVIPTDGYVLEEGVTYPIVSQYDASLNYKDICKSVQEFIAAIHIDDAILEANPNMRVKLELKMTDPSNADNKLQIGEDLIYTAAELNAETPNALPKAEVTPMTKVVLEANEYRTWNGIVSDKESEALVPGDEQLPLEVVMNFKAIDTLEDCLAGGYAKWLVDFNITIDGLANGSVVADNCSLAGNYGSFGWIEIPLDGQTIESGVTYPVVANYDASLNYKDICKSVKDFTAAIHIDQAILNANPNMTVTLEMVMTHPISGEKVQIGPDYTYGVEALKNSISAMNKETNELYSSVNDAIDEAASGETVKLLTNFAEENVMVQEKITLDLNGNDLSANTVVVLSEEASIIDSTDGEALLKIAKDNLVVNSTNEYLPVWVEEEDVSGYRFTKVSLRQTVKTLVNGDAYFRFYIEGTDANCALQQELADGGADNDIYLQVQLNWVDVNGNTGSKLFTYNEEQLIKYAANWTGNEFRLYVTGMENVSKLELTGMVVSVPTDRARVTVSGETKTVARNNV